MDEVLSLLQPDQTEGIELEARGSEGESPYEAFGYDFPDEAITRYSDDQLRMLMIDLLPTAEECVDGIEVLYDFAIDHAQDVIEQARDELLRRGVVFTTEDRNRFDFLDWAPTPEEADLAAREEEHRVANAIVDSYFREQILERIVGYVRTLAAGQSLPAGTDLRGVEIEFGRNIQAAALTGSEALELEDALEIIAGRSACRASPPDEAWRKHLRESDEPFWKVLTPISDSREFWILIRDTFRRERFHITVHDMRPDRPFEHCFEILTEIDWGEGPEKAQPW